MIKTVHDYISEREIERERERESFEGSRKLEANGTKAHFVSIMKHHEVMLS